MSCCCFPTFRRSSHKKDQNPSLFRSWLSSCCRCFQPMFRRNPQVSQAAQGPNKQPAPPMTSYGQAFSLGLRAWTGQAVRCQSSVPSTPTSWLRVQQTTRTSSTRIPAVYCVCSELSPRSRAVILHLLCLKIIYIIYTLCTLIWRDSLWSVLGGDSQEGQ